MLTGDKLVNLDLLKYVYDKATNIIVPVEKTVNMTKAIGKDDDGKLWTEPVESTEIVSATENWLQNNFSISDETNTIIDSSLTLTGAAADSKTVGDELNGLKTKANSLTASYSTTSYIAQQALERATNAENEALDATTSAITASEKMDTMQAMLDSKIDGAYVEDGYLILTINGEPFGEPLGPFAGNGGGGGGGGVGGNNAALLVTNTSGWINKTIPENADCYVSLNWSSIEDELATGNGTLKIVVNGAQKAIKNIPQGTITENIGEYLSTGANSVALTVSDIYSNQRTIRVTVSVVALSLSSTFDNSVPFTGPINFPYTPVGNVSKTIHFILDDVEVGTSTTTTSGRQQNYVIFTQTHGSHILRCYFEAEINYQTVRSNELYYEFVYLEQDNMTPVITSVFRDTTGTQYNPININYAVYNPASMNTPVTISVNDQVVSQITVDRTTQTFSYRPNEAGTINIRIFAGDNEYHSFKDWELEIAATNIDAEAETESLALYLSTQGRSNAEATREQWAYQDISATLSGFNWRINGWMQDDENIGILRLNDDARVTIPYKPFANNFIQTGKTIEVEFATREVANYSAPIFSCIADGVGMYITPQNIFFNGAQTKINTQYKENEHIRLSITVGKQSDYRLILIYINGIMSRAIQYASGERFSQLSPVDITIGSNECGIDIYNIRIYDQDLTARGVVENWIADTQNGLLMQNRYLRNQVYSDSGNITIATVPASLPYMVIECPALPQYKGDKKTCSGRFINSNDETKSFTFEGCQINVQGTSSSIYYRKNWDLQFKQGFIMTNGAIESNYALRDGSIPFNRFVLKADVASSESTNNTGLTMFYNDTCPYKTPEMEEDPNVRWGIEGIPIVLFWYNTDTGETEFLGKHNFNLPKRAPAPYGYGNDETLESWEFERNNSDNVKFKDFDTTSQTWDETEQAYYPTWYDDWEARFPSDEWRNVEKLGEFVNWVRSTDREQCTNETLSSPVSYIVPTTATLTGYEEDSSYTVTDIEQNGTRIGYNITFTKDTPAYRLTKFRAEANQYMELTSAEFYYLFTELFLMIDSRAKNMFIGFNGSPINEAGRAMDRKVTFQPYDMDTAVGTNNSGVLMFGYSLEDTDTVSAVISGEGGSDAPVFNAQDSVMWVNLRDAFRSEITALYRSLRASGAWSYQAIETRYENHQSAWSESIFNEDAHTKYLIPLIDPVTVDEETGRLVRTDRYLTMLQGSKVEQRKWWLYNRFRYMDSKFNTGDASAKTINMRLFNGGTLSITPAIDLYAAVSFGGGTTPSLKRTTGGTAATFTYVAPSGVTEMETWIYSADLIADVGDLSGFYPNELDFSKATRLRRLKIGSATEGYANNNLVTLDVRNSGLLEYIDCRNCPRLAISVNLEGSPRLKEAYFDNTAITGIELADGATIETLHLPDTITSLVLFNLNKLTDLTLAGIDNVNRLMIANIDTNLLDHLTLLESLKANTQIYFEGLDIELESAEAVEEFYEYLDTMTGITRERGVSGDWLYHEQEKPQISGTITIPAINTDQQRAFKTSYPDITVTATDISYRVRFFNQNQLLYTTFIHSGQPCPNPLDENLIETPYRESEGNTAYAYDSWDTDLSSIITDTDVNCVWEERRAWTVTFKNWDDTILYTTLVAEGANCPDPVKTGTIQYPTRPADATYVYSFLGWSGGSLLNVRNDRILIATYNQTASYTIKFVNYDNTVLATYYLYKDQSIPDPLTNGDIPETPSRPKDTVNQYRYTYKGWDRTNTTATSNLTFTATYNSIKYYIFTYQNWDNTELIQIEYDSYTYAQDPIQEGILMTPTRPSNQEYNFIFWKWSSDFPLSVYQNRTLTAQFRTDQIWTVSFVNYDNTVLNTQEILDAYNAIDPVTEGLIATPLRPSNSQYDYTFSGWTGSLSTVRSNRTITAKYTQTNRLYQVSYWDDETFIVTQQQTYDSSADCKIIIPKKQNYFLTAWSPSSLVKGDMNYYTVWEEEITDSWAEIFAAELDGTYQTKYSIGQKKSIDLGNEEGIVTMILAAKDADLLPDGTTAPLTWLTCTHTKSQYRMGSPYIPSYQANQVRSFETYTSDNSSINDITYSYGRTYRSSYYQGQQIFAQTTTIKSQVDTDIIIKFDCDHINLDEDIFIIKENNDTITSTIMTTTTKTYHLVANEPLTIYVQFYRKKYEYDNSRYALYQIYSQQNLTISSTISPFQTVPSNAISYETSEVHTILNNYFYNLIPNEIKSQILTAHKYCPNSTANENSWIDAKLWLPSCQEVWNAAGIQYPSAVRTMGAPLYSGYQSPISTSMVRTNGTSDFNSWLRDCYYNQSGDVTGFYRIQGGGSSQSPQSKANLVFGFCT